jgi:hypothetical protein
MMVAAALGVLGVAGTVSAQGTPQPMPASLGGLPLVVAPLVPGQAVVPAPAPATAAPVIAPAPQGGCCGSTSVPSGCGSDSCCGKTSRGGLLGHLSNSKCGIGEGCANPVGCGNCATEKTFLFGGCHQFFNPGNKCGGGLFGGHGCGGGLGGIFGGCKVCPFPPQGTGGLTSGPCTYFSYLNR